MTFPRLLHRIEDLDEGWIRAALASNFGQIPKVSNFSYMPIGHGNANDTYKVTLEFGAHAPNVPSSVVLKIHSSNPDTVQAAVNSGTYRCEHEMARILGTLENIRAPRFYYSAISDDDRITNILMQDLSDHCDAGDQIKGVSQPQAMAAVSELVKFHQHFWNSPNLDALSWTMGDLTFHHQGLPVLLERLGEKLSEDERTIINQSISHIDNWLTTKPVNRALRHADCRADNIMFDMTDENSPRAYLIDWASCKIGDPMADITYLLASSVSVGERASCEEKAIQAYAESILQIDPSYSINQARDDYRRNITSSMYLTLLAAAFIPQTPHTDLLLETLIHRNCAAHKDWLFS